MTPPPISPVPQGTLISQTLAFLAGATEQVVIGFCLETK